MQDKRPRQNRGRAVAAQNRDAIIAAARRQFTLNGYQVALSAIARDAGVSQGVFYRHFRSRLELAAEVFSANFAELRRLAEAQDNEAFSRFWNRVLELTIVEVAFMDMVLDAAADLELLRGDLDLESLTAPLLERAQRAGLIRQDLSLADVILTQRMAYGIAKSTHPDEDVHLRVRQMLRIVHMEAVTA